MQWRIAVDDGTFFRWDEEWKSHVKQGEDGYVIALGQDGMCPFLNDEKLCKIVIRDGDQAISHTCQTFPREEHIYNGRIERALTPGCPAVLDLLWQQESFWLSLQSAYEEDLDKSDNKGMVRNFLNFVAP